MIYFAFVYPLLWRGIEIYANTTINHLTTLITLNNKLLRISQQKATRTHNAELYRTYKTLPIQLLHKYQILIFMQKYVYHRSKLPSAFSTYFEENKLIHDYNTRQKDDFHIHTVQCEKGKRSIKIKGCKLWNNLPAEIKMIQSSSSFKYKLKNYFLQCLD